MTKEPKPGRDHEGYWAEWTWQPARDMAKGGYWYHDVRLNIFPGADGCYSVSYGETWQPERPATFLQAEEVAFAIDVPHQALMAEVERLREADAIIRDMLADEHWRHPRGDIWPRMCAYARKAQPAKEAKG